MNKQNVQRLFDALWRASEKKLFVSMYNAQGKQVTKTPENLLTDLDMKFVSDDELATTEDEVSAKGYKVNFLGFVAVCKEFQEDGGTVQRKSDSILSKFDLGRPVLNGKVGYKALAEWLGIDEFTALSIADGEPVPTMEPWHNTFSVRYKCSMYRIDLTDYINTIGALRFKDRP